MARKPGTAAGQVGTKPKPCGWSMQLSRRFIGRGSAICPPWGSKLKAQSEATLAAFKDAATRGYDYVIAQYDQLECLPPCRKSWWINAPEPPDDQIVASFIGALQRIGVEFWGGLWVTAATLRKAPSIPGTTRYNATVTLQCNYVLECAEGDRDKAPPDPSHLFEIVRILSEIAEQAPEPE